MNNIILASSSIYRKNLLNRLIPEFKIISPEVDESLILGENAKITASRLALIKAKKVSVLNKTAYVIGSDQTAEFDNIQIKKPNNYDEALKQLLLLSDKRVNFYSAVCVIQETTNIKQEAIEVIEVKYLSLIHI